MRENPKQLIVLSGDHVYKMDYAKMLRFHKERGADATLAVIEVPSEEASRFGILQVDEHDRVTGFLEKPQHPPPPGETCASRRWASTSSTCRAGTGARGGRAQTG